MALQSFRRELRLALEQETDAVLAEMRQADAKAVSRLQERVGVL